VAALLATAATLVALATPSGEFTFDRASALANDRVTVRSASSRAARLYLVRHDAAGVMTRNDRRLHFIGTIRANGSLRFSVPPLDAGTYRLAVWCARCRFTTAAARLRIRPSPSCPVTRPNGNRPRGQPASRHWHGNGLLWAALESDGVYTPSRDNVGADGSIFNKLGWVTSPPWDEPAVSGERIDADAAPMRVLSVNMGMSSNADTPSYASAVRFPTPGCWRLRARVRDVSLTYVVRVLSG
jgi:hypothetical protein